MGKWHSLMLWFHFFFFFDSCCQIQSLSCPDSNNGKTLINILIHFLKIHIKPFWLLNLRFLFDEIYNEFHPTTFLNAPESNTVIFLSKSVVLCHLYIPVSSFPMVPLDYFANSSHFCWRTDLLYSAMAPVLAIFTVFGSDLHYDKCIIRSFWYLSWKKLP